MTAPDQTAALEAIQRGVEHQVVVVVDLLAASRQDAARGVVDLLAETPGMVLHLPEGRVAVVESWWLPEAWAKPFDRNDNAAMTLVADDPDDETFWVEDDADDDPTIWTGPIDQPYAVLSRAQLDHVGAHADALWDWITRTIPTRVTS